MRECTLTTESRIEECGIVAQVVKCAPRVCGDDPSLGLDPKTFTVVLPAYAGMILFYLEPISFAPLCSPRMRG